MNPVKVAVIGVGYLGSIHARVYSQLEGAQLVGVCDVDEAKARAIAKKFKTRHFTDYRELVGKIDAASIVVPTSLHHEISRFFLEKGVNLLIEKPITNTVEEADELLSLAKKNNLILQVGHIERFNSALQAVAQVIKRPIFIECHRLGPFKKRSTDIGVVLDLMIHDIDIILGLVKDDIENVEAVGAPVLSEQEDIANVRLKFKNGAICNLTASRITNKTLRKIRIFQADAYISLDYFKPSCYIYRKKSGRITQQRVKITKEEPLKLELESFIKCVVTKERPLVSGLEGREALAIALDIQDKIRDFAQERLSN